jgi:hypothetical protein
MNINKIIKLIVALFSSVTLSSTAFGITFGQLDRCYDKLGFAYSTLEYSDAPGVDADGYSAYWMSTGGSENWVTSVDFSYAYIDLGIIDADLLSTSTKLGYRIKLSDSAELVPLIGFSYNNLSSGGWEVADIWSVLYGVSAKLALAENTVLGASVIGQSGDWDSWVSELDGSSSNSLSYGISIEQFFNDSISISLSYANDNLGLDGLSLGFSKLL